MDHLATIPLAGKKEKAGKTKFTRNYLQAFMDSVKVRVDIRCRRTFRYRCDACSMPPRHGLLASRWGQLGRVVAKR